MEFGQSVIYTCLASGDVVRVDSVEGSFEGGLEMGEFLAGWLVRDNVMCFDRVGCLALDNMTGFC